MLQLLCYQYQEDVSGQSHETPMSPWLSRETFEMNLIVPTFSEDISADYFNRAQDAPGSFFHQGTMFLKLFFFI